MTATETTPAAYTVFAVEIRVGSNVAGWHVYSARNMTATEAAAFIATEQAKAEATGAVRTNRDFRGSRIAERQFFPMLYTFEGRSWSHPLRLPLATIGQ